MRFWYTSKCQSQIILIAISLITYANKTQNLWLMFGEFWCLVIAQHKKQHDIYDHMVIVHTNEFIDAVQRQIDTETTEGFWR